ncbi:MAG TPA: serine/threonine-protein kinase, partial [Kofleriaceae bacterium]|nr:serine/threonine-protein kinase [Kofleriaceae bacterium]
MQPGVVLADKYRLERVLGEGTTGQVWRAVQLDLDRPVALKLMHPMLADREDAQLRFLREARVAASLRHPGAVRILDFGDSSAGLYLAMELLVGQTLRARQAAGPLPRALALDLAAQIAVVLDAAHRINLVHRDIKPENIFLVGGQAGPPALERSARRGTAAVAAAEPGSGSLHDPGGVGDAGAPRVRVVDFGLAFIADAQTSLGRLTADGVLGGTPAYMSPEQARGRAVGPPSDVYSLGCTLYELVAGRPPFVGSVTEVITRHAYAPAVPLRELELSPPPPVALDELLRTMLSKSPPLRPTAAQVVAALGTIAAGDAPATPLRLRPRATRAPSTVTDVAAATLPPGAIALVDDAGDGGDEGDAGPPLVLGVEGALDDDTRLALAAAH